MSELRFEFDEMHREVQDFYDLAKPFLDPTAEECLGAFAASLTTIRSKAPLVNNPVDVVNKRHRWNIPEYQPLRTRPSRGYEKGKRQGGLEVFGRLTAVWEITPDPKKSKRDQPKQFRISGNASVVVELVDVMTDQPVVTWNMDIADAASPGCMFHSQIPNPSKVSIPRLPCIAFTPLAVAEFILGELFQDEWEGSLLGVACENWTAIQKRRLLSLLDWQQQVIRDCKGPPWTALKRQRLPHDRFVTASDPHMARRLPHADHETSRDVRIVHPPHPLLSI